MEQRRGQIRRDGWGCSCWHPRSNPLELHQSSLIPTVKGGLGCSQPPGEWFSTRSARAAVPGWRSRTRTVRSGVRGRTMVARRRAGDRIRSSPSSRRGRTDGDLALAGELPVVWSEFIAELVMQCGKQAADEGRSLTALVVRVRDPLAVLAGGVTMVCLMKGGAPCPGDPRPWRWS